MNDLEDHIPNISQQYLGIASWDEAKVISDLQAFSSLGKATQMQYFMEFPLVLDKVLPS